MLQGGYYVNSKGFNGVESVLEDVRLDGESLIFSPSDPIYIDDVGNVFLDDENRNSHMYVSEDIVFVERVI